MKLKDKLRLSYVPRWAIVPMYRSQTVSDHSWRVAVVAGEIAAQLGLAERERNETVLMAVNHDLDEVWVGDLPSTAKAKPDFGSMPTLELIVKAADYLESAAWISKWGHPSAQKLVAERSHGRLLEVVDHLMILNHLKIRDIVNGIVESLNEDDDFFPPNSRQ